MKKKDKKPKRILLQRALKYEKDSENSKTDKTKAKLAFYLVKGIDVDDACKLSGCSKDTLNNLRSDPEFDSFVKSCIAKCEEEYLNVIEFAAKIQNNWTAAAWVLERKFGDKYGQKSTIRNEYVLKLETFQKVVLEVLDSVDPRLKIQIINKLRNYNFDGSGVLNSQEFIPDRPRLESPDDAIDVGEDI